MIADDRVCQILFVLEGSKSKPKILAKETLSNIVG